jgi:hypothetical protein
VTISHAFGVKDLSLDQLTPEQIEELNKTSAKIKIAPPKPPPATNVVAAVPPPPAATNQVAATAPTPAPIPAPSPEELARQAALERVKEIRTQADDFRQEAASYREEVEALKTEGANPLGLNELLNKAKRADERAAELDKQAAQEETRIKSGAPLPIPAASPAPAAAAPPGEQPSAASGRPAGTDPASIMTAEFQSLARAGNGGGDEDDDDGPVHIPWYVRVSAWAGFFMGGFGVLWLCGAAIHNNDSLTWALLIFFLGPLAATVYFILNFRNVWIPYVCYIVGFFMLAIPKLIYDMSFFELLM